MLTNTSACSSSMYTTVPARAHLRPSQCLLEVRARKAAYA